MKAMKGLPPPSILLRQWPHNPQTVTAGLFALALVFLAVAGWKIHRNLHHNDPGLSAPAAFFFALVIAFSSLAGSERLPAPWSWMAAATACILAGSLFFFADHRRFVRDPAGRIV